MTFRWFCPNCEVEMIAKPYEERGIKSSRVWTVKCHMCSFGMNAEIFQTPAKDYEQVTLDFNQIPLTDKKAVQANKRRGRR